MRPAYKWYVIGVIELFDNIPPKQIPRTSWTENPPINLYHIKQTKLPSGSDHIKSHMAPSWGIYCLRSIERIYRIIVMDRYFVDGVVDGGGEAAVNTEYTVIDYGC